MNEPVLSLAGIESEVFGVPRIQVGRATGDGDLVALETRLLRGVEALLRGERPQVLAELDAARRRREQLEASAERERARRALEAEVRRSIRLLDATEPGAVAYTAIRPPNQDAHAFAVQLASLVLGKLGARNRFGERYGRPGVDPLVFWFRRAGPNDPIHFAAEAPALAMYVPDEGSIGLRVDLAEAGPDVLAAAVLHEAAHKLGLGEAKAKRFVDVILKEG